MGTTSGVNNKRIAKNTVLLYCRLIITMIVSLYTSRIVLNVLGVEDYGVYNVVGGIVGMLAFLNGTMSSATQRFLSFEIGKENYKTLGKVYSVTIQNHIIIALVVIILAETIGLWFLNHKINFPPERMSAVFWVYQLSVCSIALSIIQVPYNAAIIAFEKMSFFAYISILDVLLKLLGVFLLQWIDYDKLILYGILMFIIPLFIRFAYVIYVRRNLKACKYTFCKDLPLTKKILSFASYTFIAHFSLMLRTQGMSVLLNIFFGPIINAANAIAMQVRGSIDSFSQNFILAVNPQIVKSYAANNITYMRTLIFQSSKFSFFLLSLLIIPLLLETPFVLQLWLKNPPEYSIIFSQLMLINILFDALSGTLVYGALATGKIKKYQLTMACFSLLVLPFSYIFLKIGFQPTSVLYINIAYSFIALFVRLYLLKGLLEFPVVKYLKEVVIIDLLVFILSIITPTIIILNLEAGIGRLAATSICSSSSVIAFSFYIGLRRRERKMVIDKLKKTATKIIGRDAK